MSKFPTSPHVCVVMVSYNSSIVLSLAADSLVKSKTEIPFDVVLIDNGSNPKEKAESKRLFENLSAKGIPGKFYNSPTNLGFSGGNNIGYRHFLADERYTHLCLLNTDVIVTDYWLDRLLVHPAHAIGPVTNTAGNEQSIPISYPAVKYVDCFESANAFATERHRLFKGVLTETDVLVFYCVLFSRELVQKVGELDTRFFPGCFEDDDYCLRVVATGYKMHVARDTFIHHWGGASFNQLPYSRIKDILKNKERFELKSGTKWQSRTGKLVDSLGQDLHGLRVFEQLTAEEKALVSQHLEGLANLLKGFAENEEKLNSLSLRQLVCFWAEKRVEDCRSRLPRFAFVILKLALYTISDAEGKAMLRKKAKRKITGKADEDE